MKSQIETAMLLMREYKMSDSWQLDTNYQSLTFCGAPRTRGWRTDEFAGTSWENNNKILQ